MDQCPKEPCSLSQDSGFFYTKRGGDVVGYCKTSWCQNPSFLYLSTMFPQTFNNRNVILYSETFYMNKKVLYL